MIGRGPRTTEYKGQESELWRPIKITIVIIIVMSIFWFSIFGLIWLIWPDCGLVDFFLENPKWFAVVALAQIPFSLLFLKDRLRQETSDPDFTSLDATHPFRGIAVATPFMRILLVLYVLIREFGKGAKRLMAEDGDDDKDFVEEIKRDRA
jgi:hypothetical protein